MRVHSRVDLLDPRCEVVLLFLHFFRVAGVLDRSEDPQHACRSPSVTC